MVQFTLKRLFVAVTLAAVGCSLLGYGWFHAENGRINWICLLSGTVIGTGMGALFNRLLIGALAGTFVGMVVMLATDIFRMATRQ